MDIREVKQNLGKTVYYDTLQLNFDGCRRVAAQDKLRCGWDRAFNFLLAKNVVACAEGFLFAENLSATDFSFAKLFFSAKKSGGPLYYQAELTDATARNSVLIVPLEKVMPSV